MCITHLLVHLHISEGLNQTQPLKKTLVYIKYFLGKPNLHIRKLIMDLPILTIERCIYGLYSMTFFFKPCLSYRLVFTKWELVLKSFPLTNFLQHMFPSCLKGFVFTNNHGTSVCLSVMICQIFKKWNSCNAHYGNKTQCFH